MDTAEKLHLSRALSELLGELSGACRETLRLNDRLRAKGLSDEQVEAIFSELEVSSAYLMTYARGFQQVMGSLQECGQDRTDVVRASRMGETERTRRAGELFKVERL